ncbi:MAG: hypothetical protein N2450_09460 [bacterium]|nr:hypothetical protein [bacterium]
MIAESTENIEITKYKTTSVAFEIGSYVLRVAIVGRTDTGRTQLIYYGSVPAGGIEQNRVNDAQKLLDSLKLLLTDVRSELPPNAEIRTAFIGYSGEDLRIKNTDSKRVVTPPNRNNLNKVTYYDIDRLRSNYAKFVMEKNYILQGLIPAGYSCDDKVWKEQVVEESTRIVHARYYAISIPTDCWNKISTAFRKILIGPREISFPPLTADRVVLEPYEKLNNPVVIDIGYQQTSILYYHQSSWLYYHTIPLGSHHINIALIDYFNKKGIQISYEQAEYLKRTYGLEESKGLMVSKDGSIKDYDTITLVNGKELSHREIYTTIKNEMLKILNTAFQELFRDSKIISISNLVFIGGGSNIKGMANFINNFSFLPSRIGVVKNIANLSEAAAKPDAVNVLGLALYGLDSYRTTKSIFRKSLSWLKGKSNESLVILI